jgi:hypothetical protein
VHDASVPSQKPYERIIQCIGTKTWRNQGQTQTASGLCKDAIVKKRHPFDEWGIFNYLKKIDFIISGHDTQVLS